MNPKKQVWVGCSTADITPPAGLPLSGFIARRGKPSTGVGDSLYVKVFCCEAAGQAYFLLSFEILGISAGLERDILTTLHDGLGERFSPQRCILTTTHTHSAPTASSLEGESTPDAEFLRLLCERALEAARRALERLAPATLSIASLRLPGLTYNRRAVLAGGRVSMAQDPEETVLARGPLDDRLTLLVWQSEGASQCAFVHFACHGVALGELAYSGDLPGQLARHFERRLGAPCLFLQGASGDINPTVVYAGRAEMLDWVSRFESLAQDFPQELIPIDIEPFGFLQAELPLHYQPLPGRAAVTQTLENLERIAGGDVDSPAVQPTIHLLGDILNVKPGLRVDPEWTTFIARVLANVERRILSAIDATSGSGETVPPCMLRLSLWRFGQAALAFAGAELFSSTGLALRALSDQLTLLPVSYASPVVGYLPDRQAMQKGGYEVREAWRFYRQPAPFTDDSEERATEAIRTLVQRTLSRTSTQM